MKIRYNGKITLEKALIEAASTRRYKTLSEIEYEVKQRFNLVVMITSVSSKLRHINNKADYNVKLEKKLLVEPGLYGYRLKWGKNQKPRISKAA